MYRTDLAAFFRVQYRLAYIYSDGSSLRSSGYSADPGCRIKRSSGVSSHYWR